MGNINVFLKKKENNKEPVVIVKKKIYKIKEHCIYLSKS
jgi:hypothetical protein